MQTLPCIFVGLIFATAASAATWQSYIDDQLIGTKIISQASISGHDGNIWAKSSDFNVNERTKFKYHLQYK